LSPTTLARLTVGWEKEYGDFRRRYLSRREYVYVWVDGIHFNIRLNDDRLCTLVMIGVLANGEKELLAVEDGYQESAESWKAVLRELKRRGMAAPVLAVGDGALGFWAAARTGANIRKTRRCYLLFIYAIYCLVNHFKRPISLKLAPMAAAHEVWPETRTQGGWCHKLANVLDKMPQHLHSRAKRALHEMMYVAEQSDCEAARVRFAAEHQAKYPKAVESLTANRERLFSFLDLPAEHCKHLRTTNVIESAFATVRLREYVTKGAGSRTKGLLMAFKLLDLAQQRWRRLDDAALLPLARTGVQFVDRVHKGARNTTQPNEATPRVAA
jgi:putative transposase